jgi:AcrR family transcriptional regulator
MVQQLKPEVRGRMLAAAEAVFAESGYASATMAAIAKRARVSTGNLYRYFANKEELFYTIFTDGFAESFLRIVRRRVRSLGEADDLLNLGTNAQRDAEELLQFWIDHRSQIVVLLDRATGSRHEAFADRFIGELMRPTLAKLRREANERRRLGLVRFTLQNIFGNTVRTIVSILESHKREADIREAFSAFWSYQLAGLEGLKRWVRP